MSLPETLDGEWVTVAEVAELDPEFPILVRIGEVELAVGEAEAKPFAVANICSHAFARLSDGMVEGREIFCPLHQGSFDVRTGEAVAAPCTEPIRAYRVKVVGDAVMVDMSATAISL